MGGSKKPKKQTVGYRYNINLHSAICHGSVDALLEVWFANKRAWAGTLLRDGDNEKTTVIDNEGLFGGEDSEGGVRGRIGVGFGTPNQQMNNVNADGTYSGVATVSTSSNVAKFAARGLLAGPWPPEPGSTGVGQYPKMAVNYRGLMVINFYNFYIGTSPYLKDISVTVERYWQGWYPAKNRIGNGCNGAHIIYEALTNDQWGLGYPVNSLDDASFRKAADILYAENFGLALLWDAEQELIDFIEDVKACIDAAFYLNRRTGLYTLKLIRAGETPVLTVDPSNATLDTFQRRALGDTYNEMSVKYTDPTTEEYVSLTVHDLGNIQSQGRVVQSSKEYVGVRSGALAAKLAQRDLQAASATLATAEVTVNRKAWHVNPGDVVSLVWPDEGINYMEMRVVDTSQAEPGTDLIKMTLVEDVFGQANSDFSDGQDSGYDRPDGKPELFDPVLAWEIPYWFAFGFFDKALSDYPANVAYSTMLVSTGHDSARTQVLYARGTDAAGAPAWINTIEGEIIASAVLSNPLPAAADSVAVIEDMLSINRSTELSFILLTDGLANGKEEICLATAFETSSQSLQLVRGLMDTPPRVWPAGTQIYFIGTSDIAADETARSRGAIVEYRPAMRSNEGLMDVGSVPSDFLTLQGRFGRPYPVANVTIGPDGEWWPSLVTTGLSMPIAWSPRNRVTQDALEQVPWGAAGIAPEEGTSFGYELFDEDGTLIDSKSGFYTWNTTVNLTAIANMGPVTCKLVIFSQRAGLRNYMDFEHTFQIEAINLVGGYGKTYGKSYGKL